MNHEEDKQQQGADTPTDQPPSKEKEYDAGKRGWRALFAKRWAFPAMYLTAAALIIALMYFQANRYVNIDKNNAATPPAQNPGVAVTASAQQSWIWPVGSNAKGVEVLRGYYDKNAKGATTASLEKDLVHFGSDYSGSTGYDLGVPKGGQPFAVVAASSGLVEDVHNSPVMGETVVVADGNGYSSVYQSLGSVAVRKGQHVLQGQQVGVSGSNQMEASLGNHLFFEVEKNGVVINPDLVLPKTQS